MRYWPLLLSLLLLFATPLQATAPECSETGSSATCKTLYGTAGNKPYCLKGTCTAEVPECAGTGPSAACVETFGTLSPKKLCNGFHCVQCLQSSDCPEKSICTNAGACKAVQCVNDDHCSGALTCESYKCVCKTNSDCGDRGICSSGGCREVSCIDNSHCAFAYTCVSHRCVRCTQDSNCPSGQVCYGNQCITPKCRSDAECTHYQRCWLFGPRPGCSNHACTCPEYPTLPHGTECTTDGDCYGGSCFNGYCSYGGCTWDSECPDGQSCRGGSCW